MALRLASHSTPLAQARPAGSWLMVLMLAGGAAGAAGLVSLAAAAAGAIALTAAAVALPRGRARAAALILAAGAVVSGDGAWAHQKSTSEVDFPPKQPGSTISAGNRPPRSISDAPATIDGRLVEDAAAVDTGVRLVVHVTRVRPDAGDWIAVSARVQVHVSGTLAAARVREWTAGRRIQAPAILRKPDLLANPGGPSETWQWLTRPADLVGSVKSGALVTLVSRGAFFDEWGAAARRRVRDAATTYIAPNSPQSAAIVVAILIGDRVGLSDDVQRHLQAAGTYHVIAISGGNVALLTGLCLFVMRVFIRSHRRASILTMAVVLIYGWLVGGGASVDRAVAAACLYLVVGMIGLVPSGARLLGVVATILVIIDPMTALDVSAWLSFGASFAIIVCAGRMVTWARPPHKQASAGWLARLWHAVLVMFCATLSAEVALAPISAAVFSRVGPAGLALNFIAIPAMAVVEVAGMITVALSGWADGAARIAAWTSDLAARALVSSSSVVDTPSPISWRVPPVPLAWTAAFYLAVVIFVWRRGRDRVRVIAGVSAAVCLLVILLSPFVELAQPPIGRLRVTLIDVGQGDAIVVQFPTRQTLLVDAGGSAGSFDVGARVVVPSLWALGIRRLDFAAFTHPDVDHIGGVRSVLRDMSPREVWEGVPVPPNPARLAVWTEAQAEGIVWRQLSAGHVMTLGSVELDVVNPPLPDWERRKTRNEDSLVLRVTFGGVEWLLAGDSGAEFESRPGAGARTAPTRLLKVGHHGSRSSSSQSFVDAFAPDLAFISVGASNVFGHPSPEVVARYEAEGALVFRTDLDGAISVETDGRDVWVLTQRGRTWARLVRS